MTLLFFFHIIFGLAGIWKILEAFEKAWKKRHPVTKPGGLLPGTSLGGGCHAGDAAATGSFDPSV